MGIYAEKRDKIAARIVELTDRITTDTAKKKELEEKQKEANRLAMAEEFNCKPRELDEIINAEHTLLQKLRASGLSDSELLEMVGITSGDNGKGKDSENADSSSESNAISEKHGNDHRILMQSVRSLKVRCRLAITDRLVSRKAFPRNHSGDILGVDSVEI